MFKERRRYLFEGRCTQAKIHSDPGLHSFGNDADTVRDFQGQN